jgi:arylsulfatase
MTAAATERCESSIRQKYPPRKLQSMGYDGPIEISKYQKFEWLRQMLQKEGVNISLPTGN